MNHKFRTLVVFPKLSLPLVFNTVTRSANWTKEPYKGDPLPFNIIIIAKILLYVKYLIGVNSSFEISSIKRVILKDICSGQYFIRLRILGNVV